MDNGSQPGVNIGQHNDANDGSECDENTVDDCVVGRRWLRRMAEFMEAEDDHQQESRDETDQNEKCYDEIRNAADWFEPTVITCCTTPAESASINK